MSIELRLSDIDPPLPDAPRTIYRDVLNLPDPVELGLTVRYFNYDDVGLYFQITGQASGYTFGTVNLGLLGSGLNAYRNLDEFGERAKPSAGQFTEGEFDEDIKLILKAYTDSGYTQLKWTHERTITVHWIKSDDGAWTQDFLNDFDDGTVQGWAVANELNSMPTIEVVTDYVLSAPYAVRMNHIPSSAPSQIRSRLWKSFTTPNRDTVYAIINFRMRKTDTTLIGIKNIRIQKDGEILIYLGRPYEGTTTEFFVLDKWVRNVVPLPKNTTFEVRIVVETRVSIVDARCYLNMDNFKILSKA